jgi:hypothetical protein
VSCHQNEGQKHNLMTDKSSFENMAKLKYLGTTIANENFIDKEIK